MRTAAKIDANQPEIVEALRREPGVTVTITSMIGNGYPDLNVGVDGVNLLMEIKVPGADLTPRQKEWHREWCGQVAVISSAKGALRLVRRIKGKHGQR